MKKTMMKLSIIIILLFSLFFVNIVSSEETVNIIFSEPEYNQGDQVSFTLFVDTTKRIEEFGVKIYYGNSGVDIVENFDNVIYPAIGNSATISFRAARSDTLVTVDAVAYNGPHDEGGIPIATGTSQIYINDPEPGSLTTDNEQSSDEKNTPGFELFCFVFSIGILCIILKKREE